MEYEKIDFEFQWQALKALEEGEGLFCKRMSSYGFGYEYESVFVRDAILHNEQLYKKLSDSELNKRKATLMLGERLKTIDELSDFIDNLSPSSRKSSQHSASAIYNFFLDKIASNI